MRRTARRTAPPVRAGHCTGRHPRPVVHAALLIQSSRSVVSPFIMCIYTTNANKACQGGSHRISRRVAGAGLTAPGFDTTSSASLLGDCQFSSCLNNESCSKSRRRSDLFVFVVVLVPAQPFRFSKPRACQTITSLTSTDGSQSGCPRTRPSDRGEKKCSDRN